MRAPHKPLLVLLALAHLSRDEWSITFDDCVEHMRRLLEDFGPRRRTPDPAAPFWHLQTDGVWEVHADGELQHGAGGGRPTMAEFRNRNAMGCLPRAIAERLHGSPTLIRQISTELLDAHFPESLHEDLLSAIGMAGPADTLETVTRRRRDPTFRQRVLDAYEHRCSVCGIELRLQNVSIGIEAAHIRWHGANGNDDEDNGLALCALHHKVFDYGAFTVRDRRVVISDLATANERGQALLHDLNGTQLRPPVHPEHAPCEQNLEWHREEVFKGRSRPLRAG